MYWVHINALSFELGGAACSVHPTLKFTSVAVFMATQSSVIPSFYAHASILGFYHQEFAHGSLNKENSVHFLRLFFIAVFAILPEMILTIFYVPVGIHYIMVQPTLDTTILATVALQFILDIDEIIFKTFSPGFRNRCEVVTFVHFDANSELESQQPKPAVTRINPAKSRINPAKGEAASGFRSQCGLVAISIGSVFGFIDRIFVCSRWNDPTPLKVVTRDISQYQFKFTDFDE
jgi:hypothetical protein